MEIIKSPFSQIIKRKDLFLFIVLVKTGISLFGWFSGKMGLTSFSIKYNYLIISEFVALNILMLSNFKRTWNKVFRKGLLVSFFSARK